jgi:hypothetical protein
MSKRSRHGNDYAPSTFPFLAVLLCVIGALILLLVINVTNSRASAKKQVESELSEAIEQAKEQSDYLVSISEELNARREQVKRQIELRRSELTRTEDHIKRLEEQLKEAGVAFKKGVGGYGANGRARTLGEAEGRVKILADAKTDRVLGVHIMGARAGDLIAEAAIAMEFGASSEDIARSCHAHPTLAETIHEAALAVDGRAIHSA